MIITTGHGLLSVNALKDFGPFFVFVHSLNKIVKVGDDCYNLNE